jgi:hypothetical protein
VARAGDVGTYITQELFFYDASPRTRFFVRVEAKKSPALKPNAGGSLKIWLADCLVSLYLRTCELE